MAHAISLTDGTTTVNLYDLSNTFVKAEGWELATPGVGKEAEPEIADSLELLIQATSAANLQTAVHNIEGLLVSADRRARTGLGARVFVTVQFDGEASAWRSEIIAGKLELPQAPDQWGALKIEGVLGITRRNYWEGPRTQIALTNANGTSNTAGLTIYNHDDSDSGNDNYLQIAAASLSGGNQQKLALAKFLHADPKIIVLDEPTRGVDVGAKRDIYFLIQRLAREGRGVVVISSELVDS